MRQPLFFKKSISHIPEQHIHALNYIQNVAIFIQNVAIFVRSYNYDYSV